MAMGGATMAVGGAAMMGVGGGAIGVGGVGKPMMAKENSGGPAMAGVPPKTGNGV